MCIFFSCKESWKCSMRASSTGDGGRGLVAELTTVHLCNWKLKERLKTRMFFSPPTSISPKKQGWKWRYWEEERDWSELANQGSASEFSWQHIPLVWTMLCWFCFVGSWAGRTTLETWNTWPCELGSTGDRRTLTATRPGGAVAGAGIWASCMFVEALLLIKQLGLWVAALQCLTLQMHTVPNRGVDVCRQIPNWSACICHLENAVCDWLVNEKTHFKSVQTHWTCHNFLKHHYLYQFFFSRKKSAHNHKDNWRSLKEVGAEFLLIFLFGEGSQALLSTSPALKWLPCPP